MKATEKTESQSTGQSTVQLSGSEELEKNIKRILVLQLVFAVGILTTVVCWYLYAEYRTGSQNGRLYSNMDDMLSVLKAVGFGAMLGIVNTILSARSVKRSAKAVLATPSFAMLPIYAGLINKLVVVGGGIAFGLIALGLKPLFVVAGYFIVQIAFVIASIKPSN